MNNKRITVILAGLAALGPFSIDTYFPSFPAIAAQFHVSPVEVQSTLTFYLAALAAMNLFHGALSDSFGRRRVILVSLAVYSGMALAGALAPSFAWLLGLRIVQGVAAGAGMIVSRALIRDRFDVSEAQKFMAQVTMVGGLAPAVAPIVGGWLHVFFGWRGPFVFLGLLGLLLLWGCWRVLPETLPQDKRQSFHLWRLAGAYLTTSGHPPFVASCFALALAGGGFLLYVATAPDVVLNILGLKETQFGWMFVPMVTGLIGGATVLSRKSGRLSLHQWTTAGYACMAFAALLNLLYCLLCPPRLLWAVMPLALYTFGFSIMAPALTIQGLDMFPERKGLASSLQGFSQILVFAGLSSLGARWVYRSGLKHAAAMALLLVISAIAYRLSRPRQKGRLPLRGLS